MKLDEGLIFRFLFILLLFIAIVPLLATDKEIDIKSEDKAGETPDNISYDSAQTIINAEFLRLEPIFKKGCFDCHSNSTRFPWYYRLPLISTIIKRDINRARKRIDFSHGFPFGGTGSQKENLLELREVLEEGEMPLWSYRLLHWDAAPGKAEKDSIFAWIDRSLNLLGYSDSGSGK